VIKPDETDFQELCAGIKLIDRRSDLEVGETFDFGDTNRSYLVLSKCEDVGKKFYCCDVLSLQENKVIKNVSFYRLDKTHE
jgi:hypothetical protein